MNSKNKKYVKKQQGTIQQKSTNKKTLSIQEQLKLFANIIVDIYIENLSNNNHEQK